jgi:hypothetical protein
MSGLEPFRSAAITFTDPLSVPVFKLTSNRNFESWIMTGQSLVIVTGERMKLQKRGRGVAGACREFS